MTVTKRVFSAIWNKVMQVCTGFTTGKPQPGMLHRAKMTQHTHSHTVSQLTQQAPRGTGRRAPAITATAQAEEEHSTLHKSTGSQQTSQGNFKDTLDHSVVNRK